MFSFRLLILFFYFNLFAEKHTQSPLLAQQSLLPNVSTRRFACVFKVATLCTLALPRRVEQILQKTRSQPPLTRQTQAEDRERDSPPPAPTLGSLASSLPLLEASHRHRQPTGPCQWRPSSVISQASPDIKRNGAFRFIAKSATSPTFWQASSARMASLRSRKPP